MLRSTLWQLARSSVPDSFYIGYLGALFDAYRISSDEATDEFDFVEATYVAPHGRRARIERDVRALALRTDGMSADVAGGGPMAHTRINAKGLCLTVAKVRSPFEVVRPASFRSRYADSNRNLFDDDVPDSAYGILLHGGVTGNSLSREPAFANLVFPDAQVKQYHADYLDLFREFPDALAGLRTTVAPVETAEPELPIKVRPGARRRNTAS